MIERRRPHRAAPLHEHPRGGVALLVRRDRRKEVARVREAVGADRPALGQGEGAAVVLAEIAACRSVDQLDAELHAARDDGHLARFDVDDPELRPKTQGALLGHEQQFAIGVVEVLVDHGPRCQVHMRAHPRLAAGIAGRRHRAHTFEERLWPVRQRDRIPAHRPDRHIHFRSRCRAPQAGVDFLECAPVLQRGADPVEPRPLIARARRRERRSRQLLGVEAVRAFLR